MTSDAKVGLLLGLLFIFIIAFLINGLPSLRHDSSNELTEIMADSPDPTIGIDTRRLDIINTTTTNGMSLADGTSVADSRQLPGEDEIRTRIPLARINQALDRLNQPQQAATPEPAAAAPSLQPQPDRRQDTAPARPRYYVVQRNDNLSLIARKFYGPQQGNKIANIRRIFEANKALLKSPDRLREGQKLLIPPLPTGTAGAGVLSSALLEPVESVGRRHAVSGRSAGAGVRQYVVRPNDSLWKIAAEQLGDGNRYKEIAKLNATILDDEDTLTVGMKLKIPAR